jgi:hypothetical protein
MFVPPRLSQQPGRIFTRTTVVLRRYNATENKKKIHLSLHIECPIFVPDFNKIRITWTDFHESTAYKILRKSVRGRTDRHT